MKYLISILYTFIVCSSNIYSRSISDLVDMDNKGKFELDAQIKKLEALNELLQQEDTRVIYCYRYEIYDTAGSRSFWSLDDNNVFIINKRLNKRVYIYFNYRLKEYAFLYLYKTENKHGGILRMIDEALNYSDNIRVVRKNCPGYGNLEMYGVFYKQGDKNNYLLEGIDDELDEVKKYKFNTIVELFNYYYSQRRTEFTCCN